MTNNNWDTEESEISMVVRCVSYVSSLSIYFFPLIGCKFRTKDSSFHNSKSHFQEKKNIYIYHKLALHFKGETIFCSRLLCTFSDYKPAPFCRCFYQLCFLSYTYLGITTQHLKDVLHIKSQLEVIIKSWLYNSIFCSNLGKRRKYS